MHYKGHLQNPVPAMLQAGTNARLKGLCAWHTRVMEVVDYAFFLIYLVEFLLRVYTYGLKVLKSASP